MLSVHFGPGANKRADCVEVLPFRCWFLITEKLVELIVKLAHENRNTHGERVEGVVEDPEVRPNVRVDLDKVRAEYRDGGSPGNEGLHQLEKVQGHCLFLLVFQKFCVGHSLPFHLVGRIAVERDCIRSIVVKISESSFGKIIQMRATQILLGNLMNLSSGFIISCKILL
ncbi:hypothetical protein HG530_011988 [Fusarium avenaceum]|nr:hypothetical protein HG530_011988 [Fusarium avenaceum]